MFKVESNLNDEMSLCGGSKKSNSPVNAVKTYDSEEFPKYHNLY